MVSSINSSQSSSIFAGISPQQTTPSGSTNSFTDQLASALEGYLAQAGNSSNLEIDIQAAPSQNSGVRQFIVTVTDPSSGPTQTAAPMSTATSANPTASSAPQATPVQSTATQAAPAQTTPVQASAPQGSAPQSDTPDTTGTDATQTDEIRAEEDAYWAAQPPAVQQLRNIPDFNTRAVMAQQLADQGYTIDKAIMVWNWDPMKTMLTRQMYGYTWVPNLNQASPSPGPGFTPLGGQTAYDPNNPPPGAIAVNTNFASAAEIADAWA